MFCCCFAFKPTLPLIILHETALFFQILCTEILNLLSLHQILSKSLPVQLSTLRLWSQTVACSGGPSPDWLGLNSAPLSPEGDSCSPHFTVRNKDWGSVSVFLLIQQNAWPNSLRQEKFILVYSFREHSPPWWGSPHCQGRHIGRNRSRWSHGVGTQEAQREECSLKCLSPWHAASDPPPWNGTAHI